MLPYWTHTTFSTTPTTSPENPRRSRLPAMASATSFSGPTLRPSVPICAHRNNDTRFSQIRVSFNFPANPTSLKGLNSTPLKKREAFSNGSSRTRRNPLFFVRCTVSSSGKVNLYIRWFLINFNQSWREC